MAQVVINNSYSKVTNLAPKHEKELRKKLSYVVGGSNSYFSKYGPRRSSLLEKNGSFPTGLLNRVLNYLIDNDIEINVTDERKIP